MTSQPSAMWPIGVCNLRASDSTRTSTTVLATDSAHFATVQMPGGRPTVLRKNDQIGEYTVQSIERGEMFGKGQRAEPHRHAGREDRVDVAGLVEADVEHRLVEHSDPASRPADASAPAVTRRFEHDGKAYLVHAYAHSRSGIKHRLRVWAA